MGRGPTILRGKNMSSNDRKLKRQLIKLAYTKPSLRKHLLPLIKTSRVTYYNLEQEKPSIEEAVKRWAIGEEKGRDAHIHVWLSPREVWPYREYTWTRNTSRAGFVTIDGKSVDLPGPEKWDHIKMDMKQNGWRKKEQPAIVFIGKDGNAKVGEGNHRLAIAKELGIRKIPVRYMFRKEVHGGLQVVDVKKHELDKRVDTIMDILNF